MRTIAGKLVSSPVSIFFRTRSFVWETGYRIRRDRMMRRYATIQPFPILGNNCIAGRICHDLGWPFLSPTVNLFMSVGDFSNLCNSYFETGKFPGGDDISLLAETPYPMGSLRGAVLHFLHYRTFGEAVSAWDRRAKRLNAYNGKPVAIVSDNSDCSDDELAEILSLPIKKRMIVHDKRKALLLGKDGCYFPLSAKYGTNVSRKIGWTGKWLYQNLVPLDWLVGGSNLGKLPNEK